jgi:NADPH:quinone reductase-like Zn-dependent oxidoreductase
VKVGDSYRAVVLRDPGGEPIVENRVVDEPGPGEAVVRLRASSLNYHDVLALDKTTGLFPRVLLSDGCGEVIAIGAGVSTVAVGDRVVASIFTEWLTGPATAAVKAVMLGDQVDGCLREVATLPAQCLVPVPEHLSDLEAASLPAAGVTAWRALTVESSVLPGERVLIQGTGGVALFAVQIAKLRGAIAIVISSSDEKLERARSYGADHTINYRTNPEWDKDVLAASNGEGAEVVLDIGGPATFNRSLNAVRHGGTVLPIGVLTGYELMVSAGTVIAKDIRIQGMSGGSREDLEALCRAFGAARIHPVVDESVDFLELRAGLERMKLAAHFGKIGVRID